MVAQRVDWLLLAAADCGLSTVGFSWRSLNSLGLPIQWWVYSFDHGTVLSYYWALTLSERQFIGGEKSLTVLCYRFRCLTELSIWYLSLLMRGGNSEAFWKTRPIKAKQQSTLTGAPSSTPANHLFGLHIWHEPRIMPTGTLSSIAKTVELIFVHGLGGSARQTWTHEDTNRFWPSWLHEDDRFNNVRISTFGYDANFERILAPQNALGISDFAKQLLDSLDGHFSKYGEVVSSTGDKTDHRTRRFSLCIVWEDWWLKRCQILPQILTSQAIIKAHNDRSYTYILKSLKAIIFLGTPHRGAGLAKLLSNLLTVCFSKKIFVDQLSRNCDFIRDLNDEFRDRSESLELISYYESVGMHTLGVFSDKYSLPNASGYSS